MTPERSKKAKAGGVTQETIEVAKKIHDLTTFATSEIVLKREENWEPQGKEIVNRSSIEEIERRLMTKLKMELLRLNKLVIVY